MGTETLSLAEYRRLRDAGKVTNKGRIVVDSPAPKPDKKGVVTVHKDALVSSLGNGRKSPATATKRGKFGNHKTIDPKGGKMYDSKLEARHGAEYQNMLSAGQIAALERQHVFILYAGIKYICDFLITHLDGSLEAVDSKGVETAEFRLKKKLFLKDYPHIKFTVRKAKQSKPRKKKEP